MKPRLLDLFCGAGLAAVGYHRAGFEVTGVDIHPQPYYPYRLIQEDALEALRDTRLITETFDAVHASPPCQGYTTMSNRTPGAQALWPRLIAPVRTLLERTGLPWVIENVPGARSELRDPLLLHGGMFGLRVARPRMFETNWLLLGSDGPAVADPIGVYGARPDGRRLWTRADGSEQRAATSVTEAADAMGVDWDVDWEGIREGVPPAYTEFIGRQLIDHLDRAAA